MLIDGPRQDDLRRRHRPQHLASVTGPDGGVQTARCVGHPQACTPSGAEDFMYNFEDILDDSGAPQARNVEVVTDPAVSSFDSDAYPCYVTVKAGMLRAVRLRSAMEPVRLVSSNPAVASAKIIPGDDYTVQIK